MTLLDPLDAVRSAMARHFLDAETRGEIPLTALICVEARLSVEEARELFMEDVAPALRSNLGSPAGTWSGWQEEWLQRRLAETKRRRLRGPGFLRRIRSWANGRMGSGEEGLWQAVAACMELLVESRSAAQQQQLAQDLHTLGCHFFGSAPATLASLDAADRVRLEGLYPAPFTAALRSALLVDEERAAAARLEGLLSPPYS